MATSKRDYEAVALILRKAQNRSRTHRERTMLRWIARQLSITYRMGNEAFDTARFLTAAECAVPDDT